MTWWQIAGPGMGDLPSGLGHASVLTVKEITFRVGGRAWTYLGSVNYRLPISPAADYLIRCVVSTHFIFLIQFLKDAASYKIHGWILRKAGQSLRSRVFV